MKSKTIICHDKVNLKETNDFNLTLFSFARDDFDYDNPSAESLFEIPLIKANEFEAATLPKGTWKNYMFTTKKILAILLLMIMVLISSLVPLLGNLR